MEKIFIFQVVTPGQPTWRKIVIANSITEAEEKYSLALENPRAKLYQACEQDLNGKFLESF